MAGHPYLVHGRCRGRPGSDIQNDKTYKTQSGTLMDFEKAIRPQAHPSPVPQESEDLPSLGLLAKTMAFESQFPQDCFFYQHLQSCSNCQMSQVEHKSKICYATTCNNYI